MFDKWLKLPAHYYLYITALSLLMVGLPLSNVLMSIGTIWIIANWLLEGKFKQKWERFKSNKLLIAIVALYFWLVISLAWSTDFNYGTKDIINKLPFLVIPLVLGTIPPIKKSNYIFLLYLFLVSLTVTTIINYYSYQSSDKIDIRKMSMFISHIRLGMLLCLAIFLSFYELLKQSINKWVIVPILIWLLYYLYLSQVLIGYLIFAVLLYVTVIFFIKNKKLKWGIVISSIFVVILLSFQVKKTIKAYHQPVNINYDSLDVYTVNGNKYKHNSNFTLKENGKLVWIYVCEKELRQEWNKKSNKNFDANQQQVYGALIRYMTSKDLRKDSLGFSKLTDEDIHNVEKGITNTNTGISSKLNKIYIDIFTLSANGDPNGHSFYQRIEHFKTGVHILNNNWLFGVGVGDVQLAFNMQYDLDQSKLNKENRHRAHNQILTIWLSSGIVGLLLILFILFYPLVIQPITYPFIVTITTLIIGFLTQDMIESQAGVTLFAVFYGLIVMDSVNHKKTKNL